MSGDGFNNISTADNNVPNSGEPLNGDKRAQNYVLPEESTTGSEGNLSEGNVVPIIVSRNENTEKETIDKLREDLVKLLNGDKLEDYRNIVRHMKETYPDDTNIKHYTGSDNVNVNSNGKTKDKFDFKKALIEKLKGGLTFEQLILIPNNSEVQIEYIDGETTVAEKFLKLSDKENNLVIVKKDNKEFTISKVGDKLVLTDNSNNQLDIAIIKYLNLQESSTNGVTNDKEGNSSNLENGSEDKEGVTPVKDESGSKQSGELLDGLVDPALRDLYKIIKP